MDLREAKTAFISFLVQEYKIYKTKLLHILIPEYNQSNAPY